MGSVRRKLRWHFGERPRYRLRRRAYLGVTSSLEPLVDYAVLSSSSGRRKLPRWALRLHALGVEVALRLFPKGRRDCRAHEWYVTADAEIERCKVCEAGVRAAAPETTDPWRAGVRLAKEQMIKEEGFASLVNRVSYAAGVMDPGGTGAEALLLASWFRWAELEPGRAGDEAEE